MQLLSDSFPRWRCIRKYEYRPPLREIRPKTTMHIHGNVAGSNAKMFRRRNRDAQPAWDDLGLSNLGRWDGWVHAGWDGWSMVKVKEY